MANSVPSTNGIVVVTHVFPQQGTESFTSPQSGVVSTPSSLLGKFLKGEPAITGTVQIMIGVVVLLFGIVTAFYGAAVSTYTGIMVWGAIIYITAGSLTVRANKKLNPCLVKASLGMNIFSTITAGIGIIMHSLDLVIPMHPYYCGYRGYRGGHDGYGDYGGYDDCQAYMNLFRSRSMGIAGVMLVLSVLEFIVSICVSAFACKATCSTTTNAQVIYQVQPSFPTSQLSAPLLNTSQMPPFQTCVMPPAHHSGVDGLKLDTPEDLPPEYTAAP
ncbi:membrane-spanning 4-domains subfamily A member 4A-like [Sardina pilchardus]|uniref:membrane-spanning 4-domains subfamily A member 4A-like n=1 Tax=Sardina pilchardus TaxID=27697 RepID=UPI002E125983